MKAKKIESLTNNLTGDPKKRMQSILESTRFDRLETTYNSYLDTIVGSAKKQGVNEKTDKQIKNVLEYRTGGNENELSKLMESLENDPSIKLDDPYDIDENELKRLAGNSK